MASLSQFEYIVAVDQYRHFGKAAEHCHVTQPTLSMQIIKLEEEYGVVIFDRSKQPIIPTDEGQALIEQARQILREVAQFRHLTLQSPDNLTGELRLGVIPTLAPYLLPLFVGQFAERFPHAQLIIDEMTTGQLVQALHHDQIDMGLLVTPLEDDLLTEVPLFYEPFYIYTHPKHQLAKEKKIDEEKLDAQDIWLLTEGHCLRNQILRICGTKNKMGSFPNIKLESGSLETAIRLVEQGYGYTLLPQLAIENFKPVTGIIKKFNDPVPSREVSLVMRRTQHKQNFLHELKKIILECIPESLPRQRTKKIDVIKI
jgi:LysR family transcriptional regulator, hydrogen peroxide-inducible genes activator